MSQHIHWLIHSEAGLWLRIGIGAAIFARLAIVDCRHNGRDARRWREYLFLLACDRQRDMFRSPSPAQ